MIRLKLAIVSVMACTVAAGFAGGVVGAAVGTFAPGIVGWLQAQGNANNGFDNTEFGLGLGVVSGLFFGAAVGAFLVMGFAWRDAWLLRAGVEPYPKRKPQVLASADLDLFETGSYSR